MSENKKVVEDKLVALGLNSIPAFFITNVCRNSTLTRLLDVLNEPLIISEYQYDDDSNFAGYNNVEVDEDKSILISLLTMFYKNCPAPIEYILESGEYKSACYTSGYDDDYGEYDDNWIDDHYLDIIKELHNKYLLMLGEVNTFIVSAPDEIGRFTSFSTAIREGYLTRLETSIVEEVIYTTFHHQKDTQLILVPKFSKKYFTLLSLVDEDFTLGKDKVRTSKTLNNVKIPEAWLT